jgi:hypothetical protein
MSKIDEISDPRPGIRAVLLTGFFAGNFCGVLYALLTGHLLEPWWLDPFALLALGGTMIGVGVVGTMSGTLVGLSVRLLLHGTRMSDSWWAPVILSGLMSASLGWCITAFLVAALFEPSK